MKITVNEALQSARKPFPKLMRAKVAGEIVLFFGSGFGVRLWIKENDSRKIGYSSSCWDMDIFEDFHGSLTIEND